jgi:hypothetical protein
MTWYRLQHVSAPGSLEERPCHGVVSLVRLIIGEKGTAPMRSRPQALLVMTVLPHLGKFVRFPQGGTDPQHSLTLRPCVSLFHLYSLLVPFVCFLMERARLRYCSPAEVVQG